MTVSPDKGGAKVVVELPDIRDEKQYNYQSDLYAATPIVVTIPKLIVFNIIHQHHKKMHLSSLVEI